MPLKQVTEQTLAQGVVCWLRDQDWIVYQEVQGCISGCRADIVAKRGPLLWIIEVKRAMGLALLDQAVGWLGMAHHVSVAYATGCLGRTVTLMLRTTGIGAIRVGTEWEKPTVVETWAPRLQRRIRENNIGRWVVESQQNFAPAGNADSLYWSPFRETCRKVAAYVADHPGCTVKQMIDAVRHHYESSKTARSAMAHWIKTGKVRGVEARLEGPKLRLYANSPKLT